MTWKKIKNNLQDALLTTFLITIFFGWGYFIYKLCDGLTPWEKTGTVIGSYVVVAVFCIAFSNPAAGAIPVRVVYIDRDAL